MSFTSIQIRYQTARSLPAPYAYFYTLTLTPLVGEIGVDLAITYPDRDDIDEDELIAEGYTRDDDFSWTGRLPQTWRQTLISLAEKTKLQRVDEEQLGEDDDFWDIKLEPTGGPVRQGRPDQRSNSSPDDWQYLVQELIQAAYESIGRERPFELTYLRINGRQEGMELRMTASFVARNVQILTLQDRRERTRTLPWSTLQRVMSTVYAYDYDPAEAQIKRPRTDGRWLNLGTDDWYDITDYTEVSETLEHL
ncbi:hypothetical protein GGR92_000049 [Spirosoma lacussanchae]|uniref:hypothetical protein n=1 Tax=Spirosoma lacussanchae TaxID=1884249 RepID=UPI001107D4CD|nr:hypothetical protein [Spirosoma lacussanchae]